MAPRRRDANYNLQEAMALLIRNRAAFVEQVARNDRERLGLERESKEQFARIEKRFLKVEERLKKIEASLEQLPKILLQHILQQLPKAVKKEIGFKSR